MVRKAISKTGPRQDETDETRQAILQAAARLFFDYGYRAVTTRQIALACGLTQPALYHHFADKQDLYVAVITGELRRMKVILERIVRRSDGIDEKLRQAAYCLLSDTGPELSLMFHDITHELNLQAQAILGQAFDECELGPITAIFEQALQEGKLLDPHEGGVDAPMAASLFLSLISKFLSDGQDSFSKAYSLTDIARIVVQLQLHGLAKPSAKLN